MLEIRTIIVEADRPARFDNEVNKHLQEGWDLVRRDIIPGYENETVCYKQKLYAEMERIVEEPEEDETEEDDEGVADWEITRDTTRPYRCSGCGHKTTIQWPKCPACDKPMRSIEL